jgi:hypothetical protein
MLGSREGNAARSSMVGRCRDEDQGTRNMCTVPTVRHGSTSVVLVNPDIVSSFADACAGQGRARYPTASVFSADTGHTRWPRRPRPGSEAHAAGMYSPDRDGKGRMFHPAPAPTQEDIDREVDPPDPSPTSALGPLPRYPWSRGRGSREGGAGLTPSGVWVRGISGRAYRAARDRAERHSEVRTAAVGGAAQTRAANAYFLSTFPRCDKTIRKWRFFHLRTG